LCHSGERQNPESFTGCRNPVLQNEPKYLNAVLQNEPKLPVYPVYPVKKSSLRNEAKYLNAVLQNEPKL
jgi:hypothetical protein